MQATTTALKEIIQFNASIEELEISNIVDGNLIFRAIAPYLFTKNRVKHLILKNILLHPHSLDLISANKAISILEISDQNLSGYAMVVVLQSLEFNNVDNL